MPDRLPRRGFLLALMLANTFAVAAGSAHAPLLADIAAVLGVPVAQAQLTISVYFFAYAAAQLAIALAAGLLERRAALLWSLAAAVVGCAGSAAAGGLEVMLGARLLQAVGGCGVVLLVRVVIREGLEDRPAGDALSVVVRATSLAMVFAPAVAGVVGAALGWRALFVLLAAWAAAGWLAVFLAVPSMPTPGRPIGGAVREIPALLARALFWRYMAINGGSYAALYGYITAAPVAFAAAGITDSHWLGVLVSLPGLGIALGTVVAGRVTGGRGFAQAIDRGCWMIAVPAVVAPLLVLVGAPAPPVLAAVGLAWGAAMGVVQPNAMLGAMSLDGRQVAVSAALLGSAQILVGAVMALVVSVTGREATGLVATMAVAQLVSVAVWRFRRVDAR